MKKNIEEIPVFLAADRNYFPHMAVTCLSILRNTSSWIKFHLLISGNVRKKDCLKFEKEIRKNFQNGYDISFHRLYEKHDFSGFNTPEQWTEVTNYRLAIPLHFKQYDKAIYLDCDVLLTGDIKEYFNLEMEDNLIAGVPEPHWQRLYELNIIVEGIPFRDHYKTLVDHRKFINSGVILFNLRQIRKETDQYAKFINILEHPQPRLNGPDQDFINLAFQGRIMILPERYNKMIADFFCDDFPQNNFLILHCLYKPWRCCKYGFKSSCEIYWKYLSLTSYYTSVRACYMVAEFRSTFDIMTRQQLTQSHNPQWSLYIQKRLSFC